MSKLIDTDGLNKLTQGLNEHVKFLIDEEESRAKIAEESIKANLNEHTHKYAASNAIGGPAKSADKVNKPLVLQINGGSSEGSTQFTFDGSAERIVNISPKTIGAEPAVKTITNSNISNNVVQLTTARYQKVDCADNAEIVLPDVSDFTEINLFISSSDLNNIIIPDGCKWRLDPNLESATSFMFTFIYTTVEWLVEVKAYS